MKHLIYLLALLTVLISACQTTKQTAVKSNEVVIKLSKSPGRSINPSYSLELYPDGKAVLNGRKNMEQLGNHSKNIGSERVDLLIKAFEKAKFFDFEDEYTAMITDLPTTYITYTSKGVSKRIRDYHGAPEELKALEKLLEDIVAEGNWQKME